MPGIPPFSVISGAEVRRILTDDEKTVTRIVENAYRAHGTGHTVNPPSYFLKFPDRPSARIIALPASLGGAAPVDGLKWIASYPENTAVGIPRASAVQILNDPVTGYPIAVLEASVISASRTAASAALAADLLTRGRSRPRTIGFFGTGLIARYIHTYLVANGWDVDEVGIHDSDPGSLEGFESYLRRAGGNASVVRRDTAEDLVRSSELIVFATIAPAPHVTSTEWFAHNPVVLHVSLRDLSPEIVLGSTNIVDDIDHCLKAETSVHLAEKLIGDRGFVHGTLYDVLTGAVAPATDRPLVFSPFGLGVLDLAVAHHVHRRLAERGELTVVPDFFSDVQRFGGAGNAGKSIPANADNAPDPHFGGCAGAT